MMQKKKIKNGWQAPLKLGIKILAEFGKLLKHQAESAKAWESRLFRIAAYILPEDMRGDLQERFHESAGWIKTVTTVGRILLMVFPVIRVKFQDIVSPKLEGPLLALLERVTVSDVYLDPANHILKNFRMLISEMEKTCAQLQTLSSTLAAKDPTQYGKADLSMAKTIVATGYAHVKKSQKAIDAALRATDTLRDKILPITRHARREKINLLVLMTVLSHSINQRKMRSDELSARIKDTIEDLRSRLPVLNEIKFPEYPFLLLKLLSWKTILFRRVAVLGKTLKIVVGSRRL